MTTPNFLKTEKQNTRGGKNRFASLPWGTSSPYPRPHMYALFGLCVAPFVFQLDDGETAFPASGNGPAAAMVI